MLKTPYYLIDQTALLKNLKIVQQVREQSGAKVLLALKCFATWSVFDLMRDYMDGTTSSSLYEVRLGREKFGGETHAYSVAYADHEIAEVVSHADKIIFNSISQLKRYADQAPNIPRGLRLNPRISVSGFDLADPARPFSRLGESDHQRITDVLPLIDGFMIHNNCENRDFERFDALLTEVEQRYGELLSKVNWVSLGGGIHFTDPNYPIDSFCKRLRDFSTRYGIQVFLEPGEAVITETASLEVSVLDVLNNEKNLVIVDAATEAHMLDLLIYKMSAKVHPDEGAHRYMVCGNTCLAGDVFGEFNFAEPLKPGDRISLLDAAGYTMVKKNWFNGVRMPAIAIRDLNGEVRLVREFGFQDYVDSLS
jgi:carboxynorspermidine decarboxylase